MTWSRVIKSYVLYIYDWENIAEKTFQHTAIHLFRKILNIRVKYV